MSTLDILIRLVLALVGGAVLGWEREWRNKPAGLKTHVLVSLGSAAFILAGLTFYEEMGAAAATSSNDMLKVLAGVIGGVGFLGAGAIMRSGGNVHGLTTAATIWLAAAIGVAAGFGYILLGGLCVGLGLLTLVAFEVIEQRVFPDNQAADSFPKPPGEKPDAASDRETN
jgi:putative Mg2+ transporter-C (MgtC) family protein